jgi:hypothetical protein
MTCRHRTLNRFIFISACALTSIAALKCQGTTLQLGINGNAEIGLDYIDFGQYPNGGIYTSAPGYGSFEVSLAKPSVFTMAGVTTGGFGSIQSLNSGTGNIALSSPFMTFNNSALILSATNLSTGNLGPFILTDTKSGAVVSFDVDGSVVDAENPALNEQFTGTFSMTFAGETVAELLNQLPADAPFSATLSAAGSSPGSTSPLPLATSPEPASILLAGVGLIGVGTASQRSQRWFRTYRRAQRIGSRGSDPTIRREVAPV